MAGSEGLVRVEELLYTDSAPKGREVEQSSRAASIAVTAADHAGVGGDWQSSQGEP
jgi:hypothetical protein